MIRRILLSFSVLLLSAPIAAAPVEDDVALLLGSQRPLVFKKPVQRVAIGDPKVAGVSVTSSRVLLVTGKQSGSTTLLVWFDRNETEPSYQARLSVRRSDLPVVESLQGLDIGDRQPVTGTIAALEKHDQVLQVARGDKTVDTSASNFDSQVQIDIKVVEVSRRRLMDAGFFLGKNNNNATRAISAPGNLSGMQSNDSGGFTLLSQSGFLPFLKSYNLVWGSAEKGLFGALSMLEEDGFAYTLAEPSLTAVSGQTAYFLAGGEIPIPMRTGGGADSSITIKFKEFGVKLAFTPTVLDQERIFLKVSPEVSEPDETLSVQTGGVAVPGLRVRRTDTSVALSSGESFVLSGLVSRTTSSSVDKFPFLGDLPVLGAFFRSTRFDRSDKELLMVVTAQVVRPFAKDKPLPQLPGEDYRSYDPSFFQMLFQDKGPNATRTGFSE